MASLLSKLLAFLLVYKYVGIFGIAFLAALAVPIPASTVLAAAGGFAAQGYFSLPAVLITALVANVLGDVIGYSLARKYGESALRRLGFGRVLRSHHYHDLREFVLESPQPLIYFSRFLTEIGPAVNLLSGLVGVPFKTFIIFDLLGEASYVLLYGLTGYFLGGQWQNNASFLWKAGAIMLSLGIGVNSIQVWLYWKRKQRRARMASRSVT